MIRVRVSVFKHLYDNNAHHKLAYNIGNKFDSGGCNYKTCQRLPVMAYLAGLRS